MDLRVLALLVSLGWNLAAPVVAVGAARGASEEQIIASPEFAPWCQVFSASSRGPALRRLERFAASGPQKGPPPEVARHRTGVDSGCRRNSVQLSAYPFSRWLSQIRARAAEADRPA